MYVKHFFFFLYLAQRIPCVKRDDYSINFESFSENDVKSCFLLFCRRYTPYLTDNNFTELTDFRTDFL